MESYLLNKEVLCILDTRQIQRFMFRSNTYMDTVGGSDLIKHILDDAIFFALHHIDTPLSENEYDISADPDETIPYFRSDRILFQLIICTAGNALFIVRSGELCRKIIRKVSRYYLDNAYSLNIAAAVTEKTDDFGNDIFRLYRKLNEVKASCDISEPLGTLAVVMKERNTGEPVIGIAEGSGDTYSVSSSIRRKEAQRRDAVVDMKQISVSGTSEGREYVAVIHADGNNLGITIGRILQQTPDYELGIRRRRQINRSIEENFARTMAGAMQQLEAYYHAHCKNGSDLAHSFSIIHRGGDDINCICDAALALPFIEYLYSYLSGSVLWRSKELTVPLYACTGIAFVPPDMSFHSAFSLADECCKSAKTAAKLERNLRNGFAGNWIDFQICDNNITGTLDMIRERFYMTREQVDLLARPYCLDDAADGKPYSYKKLIDRARRLKRSQLDSNTKQLIRQSSAIGRMEFRRWIEDCRKRGLDLAEIIGEPFYTDEEKQLHSLWTDAAEIADFVFTE